jgi:hypothetical protein
VVALLCYAYSRTLLLFLEHTVEGDLARTALGRPAGGRAGLSAAYGHGLVRNHPFNDGNMRVIFVVMAVFLELNGCKIEAPETEVVTMILDLAAAVAGEGELGEWLRSRLVASRDEQSDRRSGSAAVRKNVGRNSC